MRFTVLDRYLAGEFLQPVAFACVGLLAIWLATDDFRQLLEILAKWGVSWELTLVLLALQFPKILALHLPVAVFLGTILVFIRLHNDGEIVALRIAGISWQRAIATPLAVGTVASLISFLLNGYVVPLAQTAQNRLLYMAIYNSPLPKGHHYPRYVELAEDGSTRRILLVSHAPGKAHRNNVLLDFSVSKELCIITSSSVEKLHGQWVVNSGQAYRLNGIDGLTESHRFEQLTLPGMTWLVQQLETDLSSPKRLNVADLAGYISSLAKTQDVPGDLLAGLHRKFAEPLACLVLVLAAISAFSFGRRARTYPAFGYSACVVIFYYVCQSGCSALGDAGNIAAVVAAWLPNCIVATLCAIVIWLKARCGHWLEFAGGVTRN